jgi:undecaprenyl diphosphate synthase
MPDEAIDQTSDRRPLNEWLGLERPRRTDFERHGGVEHVGIIPDGSRRWAVGRGVELSAAYALSMDRLARVIDELLGDGIGAVSVYMLSRDNLGRSAAEIRALEEGAAAFFGHLLPRLVARHDVGVRFAGLIDLLPAEIGELIAPFLDSGLEGHDRRLYLCMPYNPLDEIEVAFKSAAAGEWMSHLWVPETVDLVFRTGGEASLGNFLPLQTGYARLVVDSRYFPDIEAARVLQAVAELRLDERKFGR